ncbi:hypothetical protein KGF54_003305 [Candida jiufengensis]|uniref:uncharacterized protein n=1 Tax=Candida jiufengensis TaxID=497108 RepID=UPI002224A698|nr:uncharacterized protein KGF54_003305 [Candida jiufengensis]KAI5952438.1 hypothetical protein KGF54_003305 [Candida jiufengensis]
MSPNNDNLSHNHNNNSYNSNNIFRPHDQQQLQPQPPLLNHRQQRSDLPPILPPLHQQFQPPSTFHHPLNQPHPTNHYSPHLHHQQPHPPQPPPQGPMIPPHHHNNNQPLQHQPQHQHQHHQPLHLFQPNMPTAHTQLLTESKLKERKSRRTHKNSRDGCPNCKQKRIKCTEELPSCHNCVKKNYRCGYLDFPKDKLEKIRHKNMKKSMEENGGTSNEYSSSLKEPSLTPINNDYNYPTGNIYNPRQEELLHNEQISRKSPNGSFASLQQHQQLYQQHQQLQQHQQQHQQQPQPQPSYQPQYQPHPQLQQPLELNLNYHGNGSDTIRRISTNQITNPTSLNPPLSSLNNKPSVKSEISSLNHPTPPSEKPENYQSLQSSYNLRPSNGPGAKESFAEKIKPEDSLPQTQSKSTQEESKPESDVSSNPNILYLGSDIKKSSDFLKNNGKTPVSLLNPESPELFANMGSIITPPVNNQSMSSLDSSPYSETPNNTIQLFTNYEPSYIPNQNGTTKSPPNIFEFSKDQDLSVFLEVPIMDQDLNLAVYRDSIKKISTSRHELYFSDSYMDNQPISTNKKRKLSTVDIEKEFDPTLIKKGSIDSDAISVDSFEQSQSIFAQHFGIDIYQKNSDHSFDSLDGTIVGKPLPDALISTTTFKVLKHPDHYKPLFSKSKTKYKFEMPLSETNPEWLKQNSKELWGDVYNRAFNLENIFFSLFLDRALNVILKVCNHSITSSSSVTCFTPKIQEILTKKSYSYFGKLIKELRESVGSSEIKGTTLISWYAGWSLFLHSQASAKAGILFHAGSASLLWNCLNEYKIIQNVGPSINFILHALRNHTSACVIPDYKFDVLLELSENFLIFKKFINYNTNLTSSSNGYILKYFVEFENFLKDLSENLYPRFLYIDQYYKSKNNLHGHSQSIKYFSPSLFYELINKWLTIIPSHAISIGRDMTPLKRAFYLFYIAVAKALANVFPIIRGTFLVDTWNTIYPQFDLDYKLFDFSRDEIQDETQFHFLSNLAAKLVRVVKFFNSRQQILSHYMSADTVLKQGEKYIESIKADHDFGKESIRDIAMLKHPKIDFKEVMISNFSINTIVNIYNYPVLIEFCNHISAKTNTFKKMIEHENHSQKVRIQQYRSKYENNQNVKEEYLTNINHSYDFDFNRGMFTFDYRVEPALKYLFDYLKTSNQNRIFSLDDFKNQALNFEASQKEMFNNT